MESMSVDIIRIILPELLLNEAPIQIYVSALCVLLYCSDGFAASGDC